MSINYKVQFTRGIVFNAISKYSEIVIQLGTSAVLARLLSPDDFGTIAYIMVFVGLLRFVSEAGIGPTVIQFELSEGELSDLFVFLSLVSLVLISGLLLITNFSSLLDISGQNILIINLLAWVILFTNMASIPLALLRKRLEFRKILFAKLIPVVIGSVITILMAFSDFGIFALVGQQLSIALLTILTVFYTSAFRIRPDFSFRVVGKVFRYSFFQYLTSMYNYSTTHADSLITGYFLGTYSLGLYNRAIRLMQFPIRTLSHVFGPVIQPVFGKMSEQERCDNFTTLLEILALISFPLAAACLYAGDEIVAVIFGSKWGETVLIFKLLCISVPFQIVSSSVNGFLQSYGKTDLLFVISLLSGAIIVACLGAGVAYGLEGVAAAFAISKIISFFLFFSVLHYKTKLNFVAILGRIVVPVIVFLAITAETYLWDSDFATVTGSVKELVISLAIKGLLVSLATLVILFSTGKLKTLLKLLPKRKKP